MKARVKWQSEASFLGESGSGHTVLMDGPPESGGRNRGPRPMEMLLMGTGGCAAFDVVLILKKGRQDICDCEVRIEAERAEREPKVFTRIHFHFIVRGRTLHRAWLNRSRATAYSKRKEPRPPEWGCFC